MPIQSSVYNADGQFSRDEAEHPSLDSSETKKAPVKNKHGEFEIDFDEFAPIIKSVLRSSNVIRRKNLNLIKTENELQKRVQQMHHDQNQALKI